MAILLYANGIIEELSPKNHTFDDNEILDLFNEFNKVRSKRLIEIANVWCVWGENEEINEEDFSKIASDVINEDVYSNILFIHDSEMHRDLNITDDILYTNYEYFKKEIAGYLNYITELAIKETQEIREETGQDTNLIFLETIGPTKDKKVLFEFNPSKQSKDFFEDKNFEQFVLKISNYLVNVKEFNKKEKEVFYIYEDNKIKMMIKDEHVQILIDKIVEYYQKEEKYEYCKNLKDKFNDWQKNKLKQTKNKRRK